MRGRCMDGAAPRVGGGRVEAARKRGCGCGAARFRAGHRLVAAEDEEADEPRCPLQERSEYEKKKIHVICTPLRPCDVDLKVLQLG